VSLVVLGLIQIAQAFQIRSDTKALHDTFETPSEAVAA
jgi:hypothetical protein